LVKRRFGVNSKSSNTKNMERERILIQVKHRPDRHLLEDWLAPAY